MSALFFWFWTPPPPWQQLSVFQYPSLKCTSKFAKFSPSPLKNSCKYFIERQLTYSLVTVMFKQILIFWPSQKTWNLTKKMLTDLILFKTFIIAVSASKAEGGSWSGVGGWSKCVGLNGISISSKSSSEVKASDDLNLKVVLETIFILRSKSISELGWFFLMVSWSSAVQDEPTLGNSIWNTY